MSKYLFQCTYCGSLLFKGKNPIIPLMGIEIKCPKCGKIIKRPDDFIVRKEKKKNVLNTFK